MGLYEEFTLFGGVVWRSHCSVGWSKVHIVQWGGLEFTLFSGVVWSTHCSVRRTGVHMGWFGVHIVHWGGLEFTLLCKRQSVRVSFYILFKDKELSLESE